MPMSPVPPPIGYTITSGSDQPRSSASSIPIVFLPSTRYGSFRVLRLNAPVRSAIRAVNRPQSEMSPSTRMRSAPHTTTSAWFTIGASLGMTTVACTPATPAYAASAPPAFPADGITKLAAPSSMARLTATVMPRALKDPVGFRLSAFTSSWLIPYARPSRDASSNGVDPSPSVTTFDQSRTGSNSSHRQTPRKGTPASRWRSLSVFAARSRSYRASSGRPSSGSVVASSSAGYGTPLSPPWRFVSVESVAPARPAPGA